MREYALVRQEPSYPDLIALYFYDAADVGSFAFDVLEPEYIDGTGIQNNGNTLSEAAYAYGVLDVTGYDYLLMPVVSKGTRDRISGFRADPATGAINTKAYVGCKGGASGEIVSAHGLVKVDQTAPYAIINAITDYHPVVIGIHVN